MTNRLLPLFMAGALLSSCGGDNPGSGSDANDAEQARAISESIDTSVAEDFFSDLPRASEVPDAEMGDLYFKLLTRLTSKVDAVNGENDLPNARAHIQFVREQAGTLEERSEAMPIEQRKELFQDSVATVNYARSQYSRALKKLEKDNPSLANELGELASAPWPLLSSNR